MEQSSQYKPHVLELWASAVVPREHYWIQPDHDGECAWYDIYLDHGSTLHPQPTSMGRGFILSFQDDMAPRPFNSTGIRLTTLARHYINSSGLFQVSPIDTGVIIGVRDEVQEIAATDKSVALLRVSWPLKQ